MLRALRLRRPAATGPDVRCRKGAAVVVAATCPTDRTGTTCPGAAAVTRLLSLLRAPILWRAMLAIGAVQLFFWAIYYPGIVQRPPMPPNIAEAHSIMEALPLDVCCEPGYRAQRFKLELESDPERGLIMLPGFGADNHFLYVNGQLADGRGRMELPDPTYHHNDFRMIRIMPGELRAGENTFEMINVRSGSDGFNYHPLRIFDAALYLPGHERREFIIGTFAWMQLAVATLLALTAFFVTLRSADRAQPFWLFMVAAGWALLIHFYKWVDPPFDGDIRVAYITSLYVLIPFALCGWAEVWSMQRSRWALPAATTIFALTLALIWLNASFTPLATRFDTGHTTAAAGGLALALVAAARLLQGAATMDDRRIWELAFALPLPVGAAFDLYGEMTSQANLGIMQISQPLLITGLFAAFIARNIRLFRSQEQISALLRAQLDERTAELEAAHGRERILVREQAHVAERQRILRDMHDGVGSQLMSWRLAAKRGALPSDRMAEGLQAVVDEMRLMIESMDSVGESLTSALALFRERIMPRARDAGVEVRWRDTLSDAPQPYGPREVLQVFRILQEAVANALKHAGASVLDIAIEPGSDPAFPVRISVADNGAGLGGQSGSGRGLETMRRRAEGLGARLDIEDSGGGVRVALALPAKGGVAS